MFSPSLVSMMLHSIWPDANQPQNRREFETPGLVAQALSDMKMRRKHFYRAWPQVPVVGITSTNALKFNGRVRQRFEPHIRVPELADVSGVFFWGRIPVDLLIDYFSENPNIPADQEYLDLGTPLYNAGGSGIAFETTCQTLLSNTATKPVAVQVAFLDRGEDDPGNQANDFGGKLHHADPVDLKLSAHALKVLSVLLNRLDQHGILPEVKVLCSLVRPPGQAIGRQCFQHANAVELLDAINKLHPLVTASNLPAAINLSMGTHVGPHNGQSPLEYFIHQCATPAAGRFLFAAAGNDGLTGVAGKRILSAGVPDYLKVRTSPNNPAELLVEFWWQEPAGGARVEIKVEVTDTSGRPLMTGPLRIDSTRAGTTLATMPKGFKNVLCQSLFHARCRNAMSCIALALSTQVPPGLPMIDLEFTLESSVDLPVSAWLVVRDDEQLCTFIEAYQGGTVCVPAADPAVIGVAGVEAAGRPWSRSSRGPTHIYKIGSKAPTVPYLAHMAALGGEFGTSFASPRACADAANVLRNPQIQKNKCGTVTDMVNELLYSRGLKPTAWNSRTGFGVVM